MSGNNRRGIALLEAMLALAILSIAGMTAVALVRSGLQSAEMAADREARMGAADRILTATTLLTRAELDQRLGGHEVGEFLVSISQPEQPLYRIALSTPDKPGHEELVTVVHRPVNGER